MLGLPIGIVTFTVLITGLTTGAGLLIIMIGFPIISVTFVLARVLADLERIRARSLLDADVARLYLPDEHGWWKRLKSRAEDPSTWLDVVYGILLLPFGVFTFTITLTVWASGLALVTLPAYYWALPKQVTSRGTGIVFAWTNGHPWVVDTALEVALSVLLGVVVILVAPWITRAMAVASRGLVQAMLGGGASKQLSKRVRELTDSRTAAVDIADAERRRIERDLHDGAQQRLVALAMDLGLARRRSSTATRAARASSSAEAHEEAKRALTELRDLVRGIHPAVLTDRGLDAALSALAARSPVPVDVDVDVDRAAAGRGRGGRLLRGRRGAHQRRQARAAPRSASVTVAPRERPRS